LALDELEGSLEEKCEHVFAYILEEEALAAQRTAEAQRLRGLARTNTNRAEALRGWMLEQLRRLPPGKSVQTKLGRLVAQRNGTPSLKQRVATDDLPPEYRRVYVEVDVARALELYRTVYAGRLAGLKGVALDAAKPQARGEATQAVHDAGFDVEQGWHLRAYS
jgi:hypothetical protein